MVSYFSSQCLHFDQHIYERECWSKYTKNLIIWHFFKSLHWREDQKHTFTNFSMNQFFYHTFSFAPFSYLFIKTLFIQKCQLFNNEYMLFIYRCIDLVCKPSNFLRSPFVNQRCGFGNGSESGWTVLYYENSFIAFIGPTQQQYRHYNAQKGWFSP